MELAKVTSQGQITIPADIRKYLGVEGGDRIVLIKEKGKVIMANSTMLELKEVQDEFNGVAESMSIKNEQDVVEIVNSYRKSKKDKAQQ